MIQITRLLYVINGNGIIPGEEVNITIEEKDLEQFRADKLKELTDKITDIDNLDFVYKRLNK